MTVDAVRRPGHFSESMSLLSLPNARQDVQISACEGPNRWQEDRPVVAMSAEPADHSRLLIRCYSQVLHAQDMLADSQGFVPVVSAVRWLKGPRLGATATVVAVIALAAVGFTMRPGRMKRRYDASVIVGPVVLFSVGPEAVEGHNRGPLFVALARLQTLGDATYSYFVANASLVTEYFLIVRSTRKWARSGDFNYG